MYIKIGINQQDRKSDYYINTNAWFRAPNRNIKQNGPNSTNMYLTPAESNWKDEKISN